MKILIDENLPLALKKLFGEHHEAYTAREMTWNGKKNGEPLGLMTLAGFEVFVTMDKALPAQQNLEKFKITVFILRGQNNKLETLRELMPLVLDKLARGVEPGVLEIRK